MTDTIKTARLAAKDARDELRAANIGVSDACDIADIAYNEALIPAQDRLSAAKITVTETKIAVANAVLASLTAARDAD